MEKLRGLLKQKKIKDFILFSSASFISAFIGVITLPMFTDYMPPSEFGIWGFTLTFNTFVAAVIVFDLHSYFLIEAAKDNHSKEKLLSTLVTFSFLWSLVMILLFLAVGSLCFHRFFSDIDFYPHIVYILVSNLFMSFSLFLQIVYRIENKPFYYFLFSVLQSVLAIFISLVVVMLFIHDAHGRVLGYAIGMLLTGLFAWLLLWANHSYRFRFDRELMRKALRFSAPLIPYTIAVLSMDFLDRVFIERYGTIEELGLFGLASQLNTIVYFLFISLIRVYEPSIIQWLNASDYKSLMAFFTRYNLFLVVCTLGLMFFSGFIIHTLTNQKYYGSVDLVIKMSPLFYLKSVSMLLLTILISSYKTFKTMYITVVMLGLYLLAGFIFIPGTGTDGMILVKTIVTGLGCIAIFAFMGKLRGYVRLALELVCSTIIIFAVTYAVYRFKFYI